jgi:hypothetical protein
MIKLRCCNKNFEYDGLKYMFDQDNIFLVEGKERIPPCPECVYDMHLEDL